MKKLFLCAAALGLFMSVPVSAQNNDHRDNNKRDAATSHEDRGSPSDGTRKNDKGRSTTGDIQTKSVGVHKDMNGGGAAGPARTKSVETRQNMPAANTSANRHLPASGDIHPNPQARSTTDKTRNSFGMSGNAKGGQPVVNPHQGNSGWSCNTAGNKANINSLRHNMQAAQRFHSGDYRRPQGYQYRHWSYGDRLPRGYFVRNYWISDFLMFGLFAPPYGLVWVRVGDDALLIDQESGDIVQVRYGVFY
jgi:Ni/Co efflux regulator RcnB